MTATEIDLTGGLSEHDLLDQKTFALLSPAEQLDYLNAVEKLLGSWTYTAAQQRAEDASHEVDELLYGGAAGGGKSEWLLHHAHDLSNRVPGHHSLLLRRTFPELERSLIMRSIERIRREDAEYKKSEKRWYYRNGSQIEFGHLDTDTDINKYLSAEYDFIGFDEASQFSEYQITMVSARCRVTRAKRALGARSHIALATNPGGPAHGYLKKRYVKATEMGRHHVLDKATGRHIAFVPARVDDNPFIDPSYANWLMSLPEIERAQYLYGDWDVFAGQYFAEFDREIHVVPAYGLPDEWLRGRGIDYGYTHPFACVWIAWDRDGRAYVYREFERTKLTPEQQARQVRMLTGGVERVSISVADPSTWGRHNGVEMPVQTRWQRAGLFCTKASNARVSGWSNVRSYLQPNPDGVAGLVIMDNCPRLIETLTELQHDHTNVEDAAAGDDHLPDALRYILAARPRHGRIPGKPKPATLQERLDASWERFRRRGKKRHLTPQGVI